jgi:type VI secretion system protein ImpL
VPQVVETQLTIDGQKLHYFNQMADWQSFRWPGETYKPGTMLTWTTVNAGARLFGITAGPGALFAGWTRVSVSSLTAASG